MIRLPAPSVDSWLLLLALAVLLACYAGPTLKVQQNTYRYVFVLDITQSMNTRDYHVKGMPPDRLSFSKQALRIAIQQLPCGSEAGIGVFATRNVMLLFQPLETCRHFALIDNVIAHLDWRMAWAADSYIERGLYTSILELEKLDKKAHLVFLTDGEQNIAELHQPPWTAHANMIKGFILGVGSLTPTPIPKLDKNNRTVGFWKNSEVDRFSLIDQTLQSDTEPSAKAAEDNYLSTLDESSLTVLAKTTGLHYHRLQSPAQMGNLLLSEEMAEKGFVEKDIRWSFALVAMFLIVAVHVRQIQLKKSANGKARC